MRFIEYTSGFGQQFKSFVSGKTGHRCDLKEGSCCCNLSSRRSMEGHPNAWFSYFPQTCLQETVSKLVKVSKSVMGSSCIHNLCPPRHLSNIWSPSRSKNVWWTQHRSELLPSITLSAHFRSWSLATIKFLHLHHVLILAQTSMLWITNTTAPIKLRYFSPESLVECTRYYGFYYYRFSRPKRIPG